MKRKNSVFYAVLLGFVALIVILDQITKELTIRHIPIGGDGGTVLWLFDLTHYKNNGAAWSMLEGHTWLFILILVVFLALLVVCVVKKWVSKRFELVCLAAIAGGGIGNAIDRIFRGGEVTDMIKFSFWRSFPTFNVADSFITVGCFALLVYLLFFDREKKGEKT